MSLPLSSRAPSGASPLWLAAASACALVFAVLAALRLPEQGWRASAIFAGVGVVVVTLAVLAVARFEYFVLVVLALRSSVDWTHGERNPGDITSSGGPATALALVFLFAGVVWLVTQRGGRTARPFPPLAWAVMALMTASLLSVLGASRPSASLAEAARTVAAGAMLVVLSQLVRDRATARRVVTACIASTVVPLTVGMVHAANGLTPNVFGLARLRATFVHPNAYGFYLTLMLLMGLALLPHVSARVRLLLVPLLAVALGSLVLTYSRGGWIALLVGLLVLAVLQSRRLVGGLLVALVALPLLVPTVGARVTELGEERTLRGTAGNSLVWRLDYWGETLALAGSNPLTGIGLKMTEYETVGQEPPHNDFVRMYVEAGVLGLAAYLALLAALIGAARKALRGTRAGPDRGIAVGFAACVPAFIVFSTGSNVVGGIVVLWYFFAFAAAALAVSDRGAAA